MKTFFQSIFIALFISCSQNQTKHFEKKEQDNWAKEIKDSSEINDSVFPDIFEKSFKGDLRITNNKIKFDIKAFEIGKIKIESGKIIACDPITMRIGKPYIQTFPIGEFPVQLAVFNSSETGERVGLSRIKFNNHTVAKWTFALLPDQKPIELTDSSFYCYGVDAGAGVFIDSIANNDFNKRGAAIWDVAFIDKAEENDYRGYIYSFDEFNLATFSTGYGDGCYATYIGYDKNGDICRLLTDFSLIEWWKIQVAEEQVQEEGINKKVMGFEVKDLLSKLRKGDKDALFSIVHQLGGQKTSLFYLTARTVKNVNFIVN